MVEKTSKKAVETPSSAEEKKPATFQLIGQYVKDLSFECPRPSFASTNPPEAQFKLDMGLKTGKVGENVHEVSVTLKASATDKEEAPLYIAEVEVCGAFHVENISDKDLLPLLAVEGASLIYPLGRQSLISTVIDGSFPAPMLGPVDFRTVFQQSQQQAAQPAKGAVN